MAKQKGMQPTEAQAEYERARAAIIDAMMGGPIAHTTARAVLQNFIACYKAKEQESTRRKARVTNG